MSSTPPFAAPIGPRSDPPNLNGHTILLTGGTGSFGSAFVRRVTTEWPEVTIRVYSRDEFKQSEMAARLDADQVRYFVGDVRDRDRLRRAALGADILVHAAAMKQVPACEYNPFEAVQTNVIGAENVVNAAIDAGVERVMALSTDKAVNPVNLYGATKLCAEKVMVQGNAYAATSNTKIACVRYGNVAGSRGSVLPLFRAQRSEGRITITDKRMTRFWITLEQAVQFVIRCLSRMRGGEIFIPKIPSLQIVDLAEAVAPGVPVEVVGIRPGEKLHELLLTGDEARHSVDTDDSYVVLPEHPWWDQEAGKLSGRSLVDGFTYGSDSNTEWLSVEDLRRRLSDAEPTGT